MSALRLLQRADGTGLPDLLARLVVGSIFAWMALLKLNAPFEEFLKQVRAYGVLPDQPPIWINSVVAVLPWLELVCAAALILGLATRGAALTVIGMMLVFTPLLLLRAWGLHQAAPSMPFCSIRFSCGCGPDQVYICSKVAENAGLLLAALIPLFSTHRFGLTALLARRPARRRHAGADPESGQAVA